jgi:hypothetical protein
MARGNYETHDFYCLNCGKKGIPIARKRGHQHSNGHYKKLFCLYCNEEINHFECKNYCDVIEFKEKFEKGEFKDAAKESISYVRNARIGKINLGGKSDSSKFCEIRSCVEGRNSF